MLMSGLFLILEIIFDDPVSLWFGLFIFIVLIKQLYVTLQL